MPIIIDEKLFAHINNDAFLKGSAQLEGNQFAVTIGYLDQYLQKYKKKGGVVSAELDQLFTACSKLVDAENAVGRARSSGTRVLSKAQQIQQEIASLKGKEYILLPGGWLDKKSGHALIYQIRKSENGDYLFCIHNSGAGLGYHAKKSAKEKDLYNPVLTYKIPKENINKPDLAQFIELLFIAQIPEQNKQTEIGPEYLYEHTFPKLSYLGGEIVTDQDDQHIPYTAGQLSGTCSQHSLHQMLKSSFKDINKYREFIYHFKSSSLDDYITQLRLSNQLTNLKYHGQLIKAIRHQLRLLNLKHSEHPEQDLFPEKTKEEDKRRLLGYLSELRAIKKAVQQAQQPTSKQETQLALHFFKPAEISIGTVEGYLAPAANVIIKIKGHGNLLNEMGEMIEYCTRLSKGKQHQAVYEQLEHLFNHMPLPKPPETLLSALLPFYQGIDTEEKSFRFYQQLQSLQNLYFDSAEGVLGANVVLPRTNITRLSIVAITEHINNAFPIVQKGAAPFSQYTGRITDSIVPGSPNSAYMATNQPELDARYIQLRELYDKRKALHFYVPATYYLELINIYPELKKKLEDLYQEKCGDEESYSHKELQKKGLSSLYYFITYAKELNKQPAFAPLFAKFAEQNRLEQLYSRHTGKIYGVDTDSPLNVTLDLYKLVVTSANTYPQELSQGEALQSAKYGVDKNPVAYALKRDIETNRYASNVRPSNETQLIPGEYADKMGYMGLDYAAQAEVAKKSINEQELANRELFHLRRSPATQIQVTLDYFNRHREKIADVNIQRYIEANLFQTGLLFDQLTARKEKQFFAQLDVFIKNGLKFYERKGLFTHESLFYIRLGYLVSQYASELDPVLFGKRKQHYYEQLNAHLSAQTNLEIKASLHQYRFLYLLPANATLTSKQELSEALTSYFWIESHTNLKHSFDTDSKFKYSCAQHHFKRLLQTRKADISKELLLALLKDLGIELSADLDIKIAGNYPIFEVKSGINSLYKLNVERGLIFKGELALRTTPLDILNHPVIKKFGLQNQSLCFTSPNQQVFLFDKPPMALRFIKMDDGGYRVQKKWPDKNGIEHWYELVSLSQEHARYWQHQQVGPAHGMGQGMTQRDTMYWQILDGANFVVSDKNNQIVCEGVANYSSYKSEITSRKGIGKLCASNSWMHDRLALFEERTFINAWINNQSAEIHLDRYGLKLKTSTVDKRIEWNWEGINYQLLDKSSFESGVANLTLHHEDQEICIVPIQPFMGNSSRSASHEYYHLAQDISALAPKQIAEELQKKGAAVTLSWQYTDSERYIVFKMDKGQPVPATSEEALYLCYIYLGSNQPEKAWAILDDCDKRLGGLTGTYNELRYLQWIIQALPYQIDEDDDSKQTIENPPFVACKLKALSLYTQFSHLGKEIIMPTVDLKDKSVNNQVEQFKIEQVRAFGDEIGSHIYHLYSRLQPMRRELEAIYHLDDSAARSLLNYYHGHSSSASSGALGYEYVALNLNQLRREWDQLQAKAKTRKLTVFEQQRFDDISNFIKTHQGVSKLSSSLVYVPISLSLSRDAVLNERVLNEATNAKLKAFQTSVLKADSSEQQQKEAIKMLKLGISDDAFLGNLEHYLKIVTTPNHPLLKPLIDFCKATLIGYRHDQSLRNLTILSSVFYRLGTENKALPEKLSYLPYSSGASYYPLYSSERAMESLSDLINYASRIAPPEIRIPQLVDDTHELLASAQEIWQHTEENTAVVHPKVKPLEQSYQVGDWLSDSFKKFRTTWHLVEHEFYSGTSNGDNPLSRDENDSSGLKDDEVIAGTIKYTALNKLQALAKKQLNEPSVLEELDKQTQKKRTQLDQAQTTLLSKIIALANQGPNEPVAKQQWLLDLASGKRKTLELNDLLKLYFHADIKQYFIDTGLAEKEINQLHQLLLHYVAQGIQQQHCERVLSLLKNVKQVSEKERANALYYLAQALYAENRIDGIAEPELNVFQLHCSLLLRPTQEDALKRLLKTTSEDQFDETVEKIIMGGGKSKVILPTLAQKKATGHNLVIIEVPRALLRTNYIDLRATSSLLFNQNAYLFEFNRDSDCSVERLKDLYEQLNEVMVNKQYMVTTGDALQSLELKYLELLLSPPDERSIKNGASLESWNMQVTCAERLILLFKQRGDLIIDEAHQGLLLKNKLNYTFGDSSLISKSILKHSVDLYKFLSKVPFGTSNLQQQLVDRYPFIEEGEIALATTSVVDSLLSHKDSPLYHDIQIWIASSSADVHKALKDYLLNRSDVVPEFILNATPDLQEKIAFFKEQVANILPFTIKRQEGEHYGPSKQESRTVVERLVAIPYLANNVPSERSQFGNFLESINYSIQSILIRGMPQELLKTVFLDWLAQARAELYQGGINNIDETAIAALFHGMVKLPISFSQLDVDNEQQMAQLHQLLSRDSTLVLHVLQNYILPKIKINDSILHSDAYSHVDMVRSCQCMTGTPWNYSTFHQRLHLATASSLGTDAYVLRAIHDKKPTIHSVDFANTAQFITGLFGPYKAAAELRAIIDINASFKGIGNLDVARAIADYVVSNRDKFTTPEPLKFILFFNDKNELSALAVETKEIIVIGSSDPKIINTRLNCAPGARFTYFDQAHTVGADIKQAPNSKALVLIDKNTHFQNFLQGSMRMRELLEGNQSMDLVVPKGLSGKSLEQLATMMVGSEQAQLQQDNFNAARAKMTNLVRNDFMHRILAISGADAVDKKRALLVTVRSYFIEVESTNFFERFGGLYQTKSTGELLKSYQDSLLNDWQLMLKQAALTCSSKEQNTLKLKMETIVAQASAPGVCAPKQITRKDSLEVEVEVQQEKQTQVEVLTQKEIEQELYDSKRRPEAYQPWHRLDLENDALSFKSLSSLCKRLNAKYTPNFSENISASVNFYKAYQNQKQFIDMYLKPAHALLFHKSGDTIRCVLLTQEECEALYSTVDKQTKGSYWIATTQHTVLAGEPEEAIKDNKQYLDIIEQVRFFNGEFNLLSNHDTSLSWLEDNYTEKRDFFVQHLWRNHETSAADISAVNTLFSINKKIFQAMSSTPWIDYRKFDWLSRYPELNKEDAPQFENLAAAFHEATNNWRSRPNGQELVQKFNLTIESTGYFLRYVEQLHTLFGLFDDIGDDCIDWKWKAGTGKNLLFTDPSSPRITKLQGLCPALKGLANHPPSELTDYLYLCALFNAIPMCRNAPDTLVALAYNAYINQEQLTHLLKLSADDTLILYGLLINKSPLITQKEIDLLAAAGVTHDKDTILALAKHPYLSSDRYLSTLTRAKGFGVESDVALAILNKSDISVALIKTIIQNQKLNQSHIESILKCPERLSDNGALDLLNQKVAADPALDLHFKAILTQRLVDEEHAQNIEKATEDDAISKVLRSPGALGCAQYAAAQHPLTDAESLAQIVQTTEESRTITAVLARKDMQNPSSKKSKILVALIKNVKLTQVELLNDLLIKISNAEFIDNLILHKLDFLKPELIGNVLSDALSEHSLFLIASHPKTIVDNLIFILEHNKSPKVIAAVLARGHLIDTLESDINLALAVISNPATPKEILAPVIKKTGHIELLEAVLNRTPFDEDLAALLIANPVSSQNMLAVIAAKTEQSAVIDAIIQRQEMDDASELIGDEKIYSAIANNKIASIPALNRVVNKTQKASTLNDVLTQEATKVASVESQKIYLSIIKNTHSSHAELLEIVKRNPAISVIVELLKHPLMLIPSDENDVILTLIIKIPNLNQEQLDIVTARTFKSENIWGHIVKQDQASPACLHTIAGKTKNAEVLEHILGREDMKNAAKNIKESAYDAVYIAVANNPKTSTKSMQLIADTLYSEAVAASILSRTDIAEYNKDNTALLLSLAKNPHIRNPDLVHKIVSFTNDSEVLKELLVFKNSLFNLALLTALINKPTLDDDILIKIARHKDASKDILVLVAQKAKQPSTIEAILNRDDFSGLGEAVNNEIVANNCTSISQLKQLSGITKSIEVINKILLRSDVEADETDSLYQYVIKQKNCSKGMLAIIAEKIHTSETMHQILARADMLEKTSGNDVILLKFAENSHIAQKSTLDALLPRAFDKQLFDIILLTNPNYLDKNTTEALIRTKKIGQEELFAIASHPELTFEVLIVVAKHIKEEKAFSKILAHVGVNQKNDELLYTELVQNNYVTPEVLKHIAINSHNSDTLGLIAAIGYYEALVENEFISDRGLELIAGKSSATHVFKKLLEHKKMQRPDIRNDAIIAVLIKNTAFNSMELINKALSLAQDEQLYITVLEHKSARVNQQFLTDLLAKPLSLSEEHLVSIATHPSATSEHVLALAQRTNSVAVIDAIIDYVIKNKPHNSEVFYCYLLNNKTLSQQQLMQITQNTTSSLVIDLIPKKIKDKDADIYNLIATNKATARPVLIDIAIETQNKQAINSVLQRNDAALITDILKDERLQKISEQHECLLTSMLGQTKITQQEVEAIAARINSPTVIEEILSYAQSKSPAERNAIYHQLATNPHIPTKLLTKLYQLTDEVSVVDAVLNRRIAAEDALNSDEMRLIVKRPHMDVAVLAKISQQEPGLNQQILDNLFNRLHPVKEENSLIKVLIEKVIKEKIDALQALSSSGTDKVLMKFIVDKKSHIKDISTKDELTNFLTTLNSTLEILNSAEVRAIERTIARLSSKSGILGFFSPQSGIDKANKIKAALLDAPLEERKEIAQGKTDSIQKVQLALAEHRNPLSRLFHGNLIDKTSGMVKKDESADAFKKLESVIKKIEQEDEVIKLKKR